MKFNNGDVETRRMPRYAYQIFKMRMCSQKLDPCFDAGKIKGIRDRREKQDSKIVFYILNSYTHIIMPIRIFCAFCMKSIHLKPSTKIFSGRISHLNANALC